MRINKSKIGQIIIGALLFAGICLNAKAADISALNFNGDLLGKVIPDGSVINFENELIGHITADGFVLDDANELIGGIVPQGVAISTDNTILGKVNNDGSVTSVNDNLVGKVLPNGLVVNNNYDVLGAVISPGLVYNDNGTIIGRVSGNGRFYNLSAENSGFVTASGYVYTKKETERTATLAGKLISSKMVISPNGKFLGSIAPDGKVLNLEKNVIGNIHANGFVYNADNIAIGHVVEDGYAFNLDGSYLGVVSYNGEIVNKGTPVAFLSYAGQAINKEGSVIGFIISTAATANTLSGEYLGRVVAGGNVVKGRNVVGKIGASGNVINNEGQVIGLINAQGPVFDYLGRVRANAAVDGSVFSLDGSNLGFMQKQRAFDRKEKEIGRVLQNRLSYNNNNTFMGISGINSVITVNNKPYTLTPYGYVFDEMKNLSGRNFEISNIYSQEGNILAYAAGDGKTTKKELNEVSKLTASGILLDQSNTLLGKAYNNLYAVDFKGDTIGNINAANLVIDSGNTAYAKVLPDGNVIGLNAKSTQNYGRAGDASVSIGINGNYLGINNIEGKIKNSGELVGKISSDNYVLDNMGALYGAVLPFGTVVTPECKFLGVISDNGDARTSEDRYIGTVLANKQVVNETEEVVGYVIEPRPVKGKGDTILGVETPLGTVLDYKNQNLGCQDIIGRVKNASNEVIGQIVPPVSAMDFSGKIIGHTNFEGEIIDNSGIKIAYVDIDSSLRSKDGKNIGILFNYKIAFDSHNVYMGRVNSDGNVVSDGGEIIGRVNSDGSVTAKNQNAGYALDDLYVYDNEEKTVGYIAKDGRVYGIMGELKGTVYNGFVLNKQQKLIARGQRDYYIRNSANEIIGQLNLDGSVVNVKNITVGHLNENGDVTDAGGKVIAKATPLQYYHKPVEPDEPEEIPEADTKKDVEAKEENAKQEQAEEEDIEYEEEPQTEKEESLSRKIIGIAMTPGGNYIGDVTENNEVIDEKGNVVGQMDKEGDIKDSQGKSIGNFQSQKPKTPKVNKGQWFESIVKGSTVSPYDTGNEAVNVGPGGGIGPGGRYNPKRAAMLAQLQSERRRSLIGTSVTNTIDTSAYSGWEEYGKIQGRNISTLRIDMSNMITADKPIPAVLARSLVSLGDAPITAIVERNIYGDSGRNVIIPAGSRIIGGMDDNKIDNDGRFDGTSGGIKLDIEWDKIIRPDGIVFTLNNSKTGDAQGRGGGAVGYVDEQLVKKYTMPVLSTIASSAITFMMATDEDATGEVENSKQQAASDARQQFMDRMDQILDEIIENKSKIQSVTFVPAGTRVIIYPMKDLWLKTYKDIETNAKSATDNKQNNQQLIDSSDPPVHGETNGQTNVQGGRPQNNNTNAGNNAGNAGKGTVALPPPASDGTITGMPYTEDEEEMDGEIELF